VTIAEIGRVGRARVIMGSKHTPDTLAKMSAAHRGMQTFLGRRHTEEAKAKIGAAHKGRRKPRKKPVSPEHRAKIAAALTGRKLPAEHGAAIAAALTGKTIPAETRAKMSASQRRRRAREASLPKPHDAAPTTDQPSRPQSIAAHRDELRRFDRSCLGPAGHLSD
jgi:hypothetical protein